jgi:hypothetical protein
MVYAQDWVISEPTNGQPLSQTHIHHPASQVQRLQEVDAKKHQLQHFPKHGIRILIRTS